MLSSLKNLARTVRSHPAVLPLLRRPAELFKGAGFAVPPTVYRHLPFVGVLEASCPGGSTFRMRSYGDFVENAVYWEGIYGYEPECIRAWIELSRASAVILDIGANTGVYSLIAAASGPGKRVVAFEPVARIAQRLRDNCALNPAFDVVVQEKAVGAQSGTADLHDPGGDNCYSASLNATFLPGVEKRTYAVEVVAIDAALEALGAPKVDLIKLDVEGFEAAALDGMKATIERDRPAILMEFLSDADRELVAHLEGLVRDGYVLYHVRREGLQRARRVERSSFGMNVLLAPAGRVLGALRVLGD